MPMPRRKSVPDAENEDFRRIGTRGEERSPPGVNLVVTTLLRKSHFTARRVNWLATASNSRIVREKLRRQNPANCAHQSRPSDLRAASTIRALLGRNVFSKDGPAGIGAKGAATRVTGLSRK